MKFLKIIRKLRNLIAPTKKRALYKIGNLKRQNARIDGLTPMLIEIGNDFVSAPGSVILSHDASTFMHTNKFRVEKTIIGNRVFLGANAVILPGVKVGDGSIIGAGAIVTKDVPTGMVVAGNPARVMGSVQQYIEKCESKGCLYEPPEEFQSIKKDQRPSYAAKVRFQAEVLDQMNRRYDV